MSTLAEVEAAIAECGGSDPQNAEQLIAQRDIWEGYARQQTARAGWEYFAGLAFAYVDAPDGTDDVAHAWYEMATAIRHYREAGGVDPRDPDRLRTEGDAR